MSGLTFDPSSVTGHGTTGQTTARIMSEALARHSLSLSYDPDSNRFTVLGSSNFPKEKVQEIFNERGYTFLKPRVLDVTDNFNNHMVTLVVVGWILGADGVSKPDYPF